MLANLPLPLLVAAIIAVVIPHLSSLVTSRHWSDGVAGLFTLAFAAVDGLGVELVNAGSSDFDWSRGLTKALVAFLVAVVSRYGLLKGTPTDAKLRAAGSTRPANMHTDGGNG